MSWRTIVVTGTSKLDYQQGYVVVRGEEPVKVHIDEIETLIVESTAVSVTAYLLVELIKNKVKVVNTEWMLDLQLEENSAYLLVVENPKSFRRIAEGFCKASKGLETELIISSGLKEFSAEKVLEVIVDPLSIDFNDRRILSRLYSDLLSMRESIVKEHSELQATFIRFMDLLLDGSIYDMVTYNYELDMDKLLKTQSVRVDVEEINLLSRLIEYVKILTRLLRKSILVLVNICSYLEEEEIRSFIEICRYNHLAVIFLESREPEMGISWDKSYIIDKDNCIILK